MASIRSVSTAGDDVGTLTITKPTGTTNGDRLVAAVWHDEGASSPAPPAGWTTLLSNFVTSRGHIGVYQKIASSEGANYGFTESSGNSSGAGYIFAIQDLDPSMTIVCSNTTGTSSVSHVAPSVLSSSYTGKDPLIITSFMANTQGGTQTYTNPSGMTSQGQINPPVDWIRTFASSLQLSGKVDTTARTATLSAAKTWSAVTIVIPTAPSFQNRLFLPF